MDRVGFSIRCPNCMAWTHFPGHPSEFAVQHCDEARGILADLQDHAGLYTHPKLLRCGQAGWDCPAPFEALVCQDSEQATQVFGLVGEWPARRTFPLRKLHTASRWGSEPNENAFYCVLFCSQAVSRQTDLELGRLLDPDLLSKSIVGMAAELGAPVTIFEARVHRYANTPRVYWVPIEGIGAGEGYSPVRCNPVCHLIRKSTREQLLSEFLNADKPKNCTFFDGPFGKPCHPDAPCMSETPHWMSCPSFLHELEAHCPCYRSDLQLVRRIADKFCREPSSHMTVSHQCFAGPGFTEVAMPITVHGHLVAVAYTGQFVQRDLPGNAGTADHLIGLVPSLAQYRALLERYFGILNSSVQSDPADPHGQLLLEHHVTRQQVAKKVEELRQNVDMIESIAETRYRLLRARTEALFKQELIARIDSTICDAGSEAALFHTLLMRMRQFWAFRRAYLFVHSQGGHSLTLIAADPPGGGVPQELPVQEPLWLPDHLPTCYVYNTQSHILPEGQRQFSQIVNALVPDYEPDMSAPPGMLFVLTPLGERVLIFVFCEPDISSMSMLPQVFAPCDDDEHEMICQTCHDITARLREIWYRHDLDSSLRSIGHSLRTPLHIIRGPLGRLKREVESVPKVFAERVAGLLHAAQHTLHAAERGVELARGEICKFEQVLSKGMESHTLHLEPLDLPLLIEGALDYFCPRSEAFLKHGSTRTLPLKWTLTYNTLRKRHVLGNATSLTTVLFNVLDNAYKYSAPGTEVTIDCTTCADAIRNRVDVTNIGVPIDQDEIGLVCHRNYRGRHVRARMLRSVEGTGLGLYLVSTIIEAHRGQLQVSCGETLSGSLLGYAPITVSILLPVCEDNGDDTQECQ